MSRDVKNQLTIIYWRDIPAQVTARSGRQKATIELPRRFQAAIDRAAAVAGKETYDKYIEEWRPRDVELFRRSPEIS